MKFFTDLRPIPAIMMLLVCAACGIGPQPPQEAGKNAVELGGAPRIVELPPPIHAEGGETCFNAMDDNANGLLDEGCGVHQGEVQFMIAWGDRELDVDLLVTDPSGQVAREHSATSLGLTLSADCPGDEDPCAGHPHENVVLEAEEIPEGSYSVRVRYEGDQRFSQAEPLWVWVGVRTPAQTHAYRVAFFHPGQDVLLDFDVTSGEPPAKSQKPGPRRDD